MLRLNLGISDDQPLNLLCIGAHSDDIEIGAGGTILTLLQQRPVNVRWVVFSASGDRINEARTSARFFLSHAREAHIDIHPFRDGYFPAESERIKDVFEELKREMSPDLILTHIRQDHHQDHRTLAELTWNTFRSHLILGYEIPKYDPDIGNPNLFVALSAHLAEAKVRGLMGSFQTQQYRHWFTPDTFYSMMRIRGLQAAAESGMAEAFYAPKLWL
jgi:LmbE family N-acetylglucosaminyl deacetylase